MKILVDSAMPNALEVFSPYGEVVLKPGRDIVGEDLKDIDALMIRSVTKVDEKLLAGASKLKFIGTATAGCDHVDEGLLKQLKIGFASAPGANKESVGDYILSVLLVFAQRYDLKLDGMSIGVVGCGNTGSEVIKKAEALNVDMVIFNNELSGTQTRNLADIFSCEVFDRTALILEIFSRRARTKEAKLQVEVARLEYMLPRLVGLHKSLGRQGGGAGFFNKGSGEKKIELDRRRIEDKLNRLKNLLLLKEEIRTEESIIDTVLDIAGYAVLFSIYLKEQGGSNEK